MVRTKNYIGNVDLGNMFKLLHLWKKFKKGKDKYMVLAGDFMHVLAAVLAS